MRVLLLNPPGSRRYLRDYYCTTIAKSDYYYHPVDLLYLSGTLSSEHEVFALDALARGLSVGAALAEISSCAPDVVISLVATPSFAEDQAFLASLKRLLPQVRLIGTGDVFRELREEAFQLMPDLEASLVDFSTDDILRYLRGAPGAPIENIIYRQGTGLFAGPERHGRGSFSIPLPRLSLFPDDLYSFPFVRQMPFMTVLSDFGCPYACAFCPVGTLGFKLRPVAEVLREIMQLWQAGCREVHFRDQTFGVQKERTLELCRAIEKGFPQLTWSCFSRVDVMDAERAAAMKSSGCHTVIFGIEFDDDKMHQAVGKNIRRSQMFDAVRICRAQGLQVVGTFLLGLPEHDEAAVARAGRLACDLDLDFASFNLAAPRPGTSLRRTWTPPRLAPERLDFLRRAVERRFYLRPSYIMKKISRIRSFAQLRVFLKNSVSLFF